MSLLLVVWVSLHSWADDKTSHIICKNKKAVRTIRVDLTQPECQTIYTKEGVDKKVAQGKNPESCFKVLSNIQKNIEEAGWKCRDVSKSTVSKSE